MRRDIQTQEAIAHAASAFINLESNRQSLITVTRAVLQDRGKTVTIFFTVLPDRNTHAVSDFLSRKRDEFRVFLKKNLRLRTLPSASFLPDPTRGIEEVERA